VGKLEDNNGSEPQVISSASLKASPSSLRSPRLQRPSASVSKPSFDVATFVPTAKLLFAVAEQSSQVSPSLSPQRDGSNLAARLGSLASRTPSLSSSVSMPLSQARSPSVSNGRDETLFGLYPQVVSSESLKLSLSASLSPRLHQPSLSSS